MRFNSAWGFYSLLGRVSDGMYSPQQLQPGYKRLMAASDQPSKHLTSAILMDQMAPSKLFVYKPHPTSKFLLIRSLHMFFVGKTVLLLPTVRTSKQWTCEDVQFAAWALAPRTEFRETNKHFQLNCLTIAHNQGQKWLSSDPHDTLWRWRETRIPQTDGPKNSIVEYPLIVSSPVISHHTTFHSSLDDGTSIPESAVSLRKWRRPTRFPCGLESFLVSCDQRLSFSLPELAQTLSRNPSCQWNGAMIFAQKQELSLKYAPNSLFNATRITNAVC